MSAETSASDSNMSEDTIKIRVDRQALLAIAGNPAIVAALVQTGFSINEIYKTDVFLDACSIVSSPSLLSSVARFSSPEFIRMSSSLPHIAVLH